MSTRRRYAVIAVLLVLFVLLLLAVALHTVVDRVDHDIWHWTLRHQIRWLVDVGTVLTGTFAPPVDVAAVLLVAARVSYQRRQWRPLREAVLVVVVLAVLVLGLKAGVGRPGPGSLATRPVNGSFPSGHAASVLVCGAASLVLSGWGRRRWTWAVLSALVLVMGAFLVYDHYHFVSEVVASALLGSAVVLLLVPRLRAAGAG